MRNWILFGFVVFVIAIALRYLPGLGRFALWFGSQVIPTNLVAFWLVLAAGGIVILVKLIALIAGRAHK